MKNNSDTNNTKRSLGLSEFKKIYDAYYSELCMSSMRIGLSREEAEDVVQELFVLLWERDSLSEITSIKGYLYRATRNSSLKFLKKNNKEDKILEQEISIYCKDTELCKLLDDEINYRKIVFDCMDKLPHRCGEVFRLSRLEKLKQSEISEELSISISTIKAQLSRAMMYLKECSEKKCKEM